MLRQLSIAWELKGDRVLPDQDLIKLYRGAGEQ